MEHGSTPVSDPRRANIVNDEAPCFAVFLDNVRLMLVPMVERPLDSGDYVISWNVDCAYYGDCKRTEQVRFPCSTWSMNEQVIVPWNLKCKVFHSSILEPRWDTYSLVVFWSPLNYLRLSLHGGYKRRGPLFSPGVAAGVRPHH